MQPSLSLQLRVLKKYLTIGVSRDILEDLEQKALDDAALPHGEDAYTRVEVYCLRTGIKSIAQVAPLFMLASKLGKDATGRRAKLAAQLAESSYALNRITGQLTALLREKPARKAKKAARKSPRKAATKSARKPGRRRATA